MSYRNKTYVIFDGDDIRYYRLMQAWNKTDNIDFNFYDAHDIRPLEGTEPEDKVKRALRERMVNAKQAVVLVGEKTKNLYRFVRWEIALAIEKDLPIVVVNLNDKRTNDPDRCPAILEEHYAVHVSFRAKIIKCALDNFPGEYAKRDPEAKGPWVYGDSVYRDLGLL